MFTYIKKNVDGFYLELAEKLPAELYSDLGETYEDFIQNKWVLLSDEQVKFHQENPNASVQEVWNMELTPVHVHVRDLADAKREMQSMIDHYDNSDNVNSFTVNGVIPAWFSVQERLNYKQSVEAAKLMNVQELSFYVGDNMLTVATEKAEQLLAALQLYADACFMVTKQHKLAVEALDSIEAVDNYDYTTGYPEKLNFELV